MKEAYEKNNIRHRISERYVLSTIDDWLKNYKPRADLWLQINLREKTKKLLKGHTQALVCVLLIIGAFWGLSGPLGMFMNHIPAMKPYESEDGEEVAEAGGEKEEPVADNTIIQEPVDDVNEYKESYIVAAANLHVRTDHGVEGKPVDYLTAGEGVDIIDSFTDGRKKWYEIALPDGKTGWINSKGLKKEYENEIAIASIKTVGTKIEIPFLYDGYIETHWEIPEKEIEDQVTIELTLEEKAVISELILYSGNYYENNFDSYGKVSAVRISFDGENEIFREIDTSYNLEGYFIEIGKEIAAEKITITLTKMEYGDGRNVYASRRACLGEIIVLGGRVEQGIR